LSLSIGSEDCLPVVAGWGQNYATPTEVPTLAKNYPLGRGSCRIIMTDGVVCVK